MAAGSKGAGSSSSPPASRREKSSTSLTTLSKVLLASRMWPTWRAAVLVSPRERRSTSAKPMMAVSGVRSSWVMLARKSDLAAEAVSASSRALARSISSFLRSVMSREVTSRMFEPSPSRE